MSILSDEQTRRGMPTHLRTNGTTVTHRPRSGTEILISAVFAEGPAQPLTDDRHGRQVTRTGSLLVESTDINGNAYTIDDQGEFVIQGNRWAVVGVANPPGGTVVAVKFIDHKTVRHMSGNS